MMRMAALLLVSATPLMAELHLAEFHAGVLACDDRSCIGEAASLCMDIEDDGQTTIGMVDCMAQEAAIWDELLNEAYGAVITQFQNSDSFDRKSAPEYAIREESLRVAQRAWIAFRDANCAADYAAWGAGSMRQIAGASCILQMTAERTLDLRTYLEMFP